MAWVVGPHRGKMVIIMVIVISVVQLMFRTSMREQIGDGAGGVPPIRTLEANKLSGGRNVGTHGNFVSGNNPAASSFRRQLSDAAVANSKLPNVNFPGAIAAAQSVLSLIKNRYELDKQQGKSFWYSANNVGTHVWDIIKYKYASKIVQGNARFLMIFAGSSVTAGHDGYYNQSFPYVVLHRMEPILKYLGVQLVVHNIGQGANNCIPYSFCYESMGGMDPDFVAWEQAYNCGHDEPIFELVARLASMSANRAITYYSASGAWKPDKCPKSPDAVPYCAEEWTPQTANLPSWAPNKEDVQSQKALLDKFYKGGDSSKRYRQHDWMSRLPN
jgi:hypothetical protein